MLQVCRRLLVCVSFMLCLCQELQVSLLLASKADPAGAGFSAAMTAYCRRRSSCVECLRILAHPCTAPCTDGFAFTAAADSEECLALLLEAGVLECFSTDPCSINSRRPMRECHDVREHWTPDEIDSNLGAVELGICSEKQ